MTDWWPLPATINIQLWDRQTGKHLRTLKGHNGPVHGIAFSPDGTVLASAGDAAVKLWHVTSGQRLDTFGQHRRAIHHLPRRTAGL